MRFGLRGVLLVGAGCWALACGGRDAGDLVDYNGTFPVNGGSGGQAAGGNNGKVGGAGTIGGTRTSGGAPSVGGGVGVGGAGGGSTGVGGRPVGIGGAIATTGGAPSFPMPQDRCSNFCGLLKMCGQGSPECSSSCSSYLSQVPQDTACYNSRLLALDCYQSILQFGCRVEDAQAKCGDILAEADRCAQPPPPPPPPGTCENYCQLNLQCSGAPLDNRYSDCVNTCYNEIYSYSPQCQGYVQAGKDCRSAVLSERCDFNDTQNRCSYWDSNASSCQFGNPKPNPNPIPVPPQGCFGSVSVNAPGYCDSQLSCSSTTFALQCQPNGFSMTSTCTCTQYYQGAGGGGFGGFAATGGSSGFGGAAGGSSGSIGGVSAFSFDVNFGDCQTALNYCSATSTAPSQGGL